MIKRDPQLRKIARQRLSARYLTALRVQLGARLAAYRNGAQSVGRAALAGGLAARDLAVMHGRAVARLTSAHGFGTAGQDGHRRAGFFFAEALKPIDAAQRATHEANRRLELRSARLSRLAAATVQANKGRIAREIVRRKAGEAAVRKGRLEYRTLLAESQAMQRQLRQLARQVLQAQEEERKEISRELHDEVVQTLLGINVELSNLSKGTALSLHALKTKIARTRRLVQHSVKAVHRFARELRPAVLDDFGLIPALHAYSQGLAERKKLKIKMTAFRGVEALGSAKRTVLFRVAQEALTNIARHAQATQVRMSITEISGAIRMEIGDNGKSFDVDKTYRSKLPKRLGLIGMKERVEMVGGTFAIESAPGKGTTVRVEIPLTRNSAQSPWRTIA